MSDIKIFNISGGAVIMINPPIDYEEITDVRLYTEIFTVRKVNISLMKSMKATKS